MKAEVKIPKGWRRTKSRITQTGDRALMINYDGTAAWKLIMPGDDVRNYAIVIRKHERR